MAKKRASISRKEKKLIEHFDRGEWYAIIEHRENQALMQHATEKGWECLEAIRAAKSAAKRKPLVESLGVLINFGGSKTKRYRTLLAACLESHNLLVQTRDGATLEDVATAAGLSSKGIALELVAIGGKLAAEHFEIVADAARKWLTPSEFYTQFARYMNPSAPNGTDKGKRDRALFQVLSRELSALWQYDDFSAGKKAKRKLDPRWLAAAFAKKDEDLIVELAPLKHPKLERFLSKQLEVKKNKDPYNAFRIVEAHVRSKHPNAASVTLAFITKKALSKRFDPDYQRWMFLLKDLPKKIRSQVEDLVEEPKCNEVAKKEIPHWLSIPHDNFFDIASMIEWD